MPFPKGRSTWARQRGLNLSSAEAETARFMEQVEKIQLVDGFDECWRWKGRPNGGGYGRFSFRGRMVGAHRAAYEIWRGPVPDGREPDHLCRVRLCANPWHLEAVTRQVNLLRGATVTARNAAATHCPHGHPYDAANTHYNDRGWRTCKACWKVRRDQRRAKRDAAREAAGFVRPAMSEARMALLQVLRNAEAPLGMTAIAKALSKPRGTVGYLLFAMRHAGEVQVNEDHTYRAV